MKLQGKIQQADQTNQNGRVYPFNEMQNAVNELQQRLQNGEHIVSELDHPTDRLGSEWGNAVSRLIQITMQDDGSVYGVFDILNNEKGDDFARLMQQLKTVGVSVRGSGNVNNNGEVSEYSIEGFDIVVQPSVSDAKLTLTECKHIGYVFEATDDFTALNKQQRPTHSKPELQQKQEAEEISNRELINICDQEEYELTETEAEYIDQFYNNQATNEVNDIASLSNALQQKLADDRAACEELDDALIHFQARTGR